jgi:Fe-S-cluster containining protein
MTLGHLYAEVDAFFARARRRVGAGDLQCRQGCDDCCKVELVVSGVEAEAVRALLDATPAAARAALMTRARARTEGRCPALEADGRCGIYQARPLACRMHGLPVRLPGRRGLPVIDACERNFQAAGPAAASPDCVLDQTALTDRLAALEAARAEPAERIALREVLASARADRRSPRPW